MGRPFLTQTPIEALSAPVQTDLNSLIHEFGWEERDLLGALAELGERLDAWGIVCVPALSTGSLTTPRVLSPPRATNPLLVVTSEIASGEGPSLEFKETLFLDVKKHVIGKQPLESC